MSRLPVRIRQHLAIVAFIIGSLSLVYVIVPGNDARYLWSMSTAYTSLLLFGITLLIGPLNILLRKHNPVSSDIRRDFGIWCAIIGPANLSAFARLDCRVWPSLAWS